MCNSWCTSREPVATRVIIMMLSKAGLLLLCTEPGTVMEIIIYLQTTPSTFPCNFGNWSQNTVFRSYFSRCYGSGNCLNDTYHPLCDGLLVQHCADDVTHEQRQSTANTSQSYLCDCESPITHTPPHGAAVPLQQQQNVTDPHSQCCLYRICLIFLVMYTPKSPSLG